MWQVPSELHGKTASILPSYALKCLYCPLKSEGRRSRVHQLERQTGTPTEEQAWIQKLHCLLYVPLKVFFTREPMLNFLEWLQPLLQNVCSLCACPVTCLASETVGGRASSIANICLILAVSDRISQFKQDEEQLKKKSSSDLCVKKDIEKTSLNPIEYPPNLPWKYMKCKLPIVYCFSKGGCKLLCVTVLTICLTMRPPCSQPMKERIIWFNMNQNKNWIWGFIQRQKILEVNRY